jgi:hypothetical protein
VATFIDVPGFSIIIDGAAKLIASRGVEMLVGRLPL